MVREGMTMENCDHKKRPGCPSLFELPLASRTKAATMTELAKLASQAVRLVRVTRYTRQPREQRLDAVSVVPHDSPPSTCMSRIAAICYAKNRIEKF
jgi:hypothetical protein